MHLLAESAIFLGAKENLFPMSYRRTKKNEDLFRGRLLLDQLLQRRGLSVKVKGLQALQAFSKACGPWLAQYARGERYSRGTLYIRVSHPTFTHELSCMKGQLLSQLQKIPGGEFVKELRFFIGPVEELPAWTQEELISPADLEVEPHPAVFSAIATMHDVELQEAFASFYLQAQRKLPSASAEMGKKHK